MNSEDMRTGSDTNSACLRGLRTRDVPTGTLWTLRLKQTGYRGIGARSWGLVVLAPQIKYRPSNKPLRCAVAPPVSVFGIGKPPSC